MRPRRPGVDPLSVLALEEAAVLAAAAFRVARVPDHMAVTAAETLVLAEAMGISTHGLGRVRDYVTRIEAGGINPAAKCMVTHPAPALCVVDGCHGLGPAIARQALGVAMEVAGQAGIAAAFVRNASHLGALAPLLYRAAEAGFAAIMTTNTAPMIAPPSGRKPLVGNNPFGIVLPHPDGRHLMLDMALSVVSRSRVRAASENGKNIPETWATDANGRPTTDPVEAMKGMMQAIGGDKGASLALTLDLLASVLAGASFLSQIPTASRSPEKPQGLGQMFLLIDASRLLPKAEQALRMNEAERILTASPPRDPDHPVRRPGTRALQRLHVAREQGLTLSDELLSELRHLGAKGD